MRVVLANSRSTHDRLPCKKNSIRPRNNQNCIRLRRADLHARCLVQQELFAYKVTGNECDFPGGLSFAILFRSKGRFQSNETFCSNSRLHDIHRFIYCYSKHVLYLPCNARRTPMCSHSVHPEHFSRWVGPSTPPPSPQILLSPLFPLHTGILL